jgi:ribosomal protein S18 acetylase RimI-like enzyme
MLAEVEPLGVAEAEACTRLSALAGWTHEPADWRARLGAGRGLGIRREGRLVACGLLLDGPGGAAFLGNLLTEPESRCQGHAAAILDAALELCAREGRRAHLISVPKAVSLYERFGFRTIAVMRSFRGAPPHAEPAGVRRAAEAHLRWNLAQDAAAWGAGRAALLRDQAARFAQHVWIADGDSGPCGFAMAADRGGVRNIGPVIAASTECAARLALAAMQGAARVRLDSLDAHADFHAVLGLSECIELPLMAHGSAPAGLPFADPSRVFAAQSAAAG